jgi:hypothetical protein
VDTFRSAANRPGDPAICGNLGITKPVQRLPIIQETGDPTQEPLYGFTQEELVDRKSRKEIREISGNPVLRFQINQLLDRLGREEDTEALKEQIVLATEPFMAQIDIVTNMKGVSVFIAIIADSIDVSWFKESRHVTFYLHSAPPMTNSNMSVKNKGTNKAGCILSAALLIQSLNHCWTAVSSCGDGMTG